MQTIQSYWGNLGKYLTNPSALTSAAESAASSAAAAPQSILQRAQGMDRKQMAALGIVGAELLGFFTVGEMIGKFKVVGYRSSQVHHE